jgi:hypothetical protein
MGWWGLTVATRNLNLLVIKLLTKKAITTSKRIKRLTHIPTKNGYQTSNKAVMHHYLRSKPSVMYLILVALDVESSNLMEYPTFLPSWSLHSSATRFATVTAATLRG